MDTILKSREVFTFTWLHRIWKVTASTVEEKGREEKEMKHWGGGRKDQIADVGAGETSSSQEPDSRDGEVISSRIPLSLAGPGGPGPKPWCIDFDLPSMHFHADKVAEIKEEIELWSFLA